MAEERPSKDDQVWYDVVCSECGDEFRVPFEPEKGRRLLCKSCLRSARQYEGHREGRSDRDNRRDHRHDRDNRREGRDFHGNRSRDSRRSQEPAQLYPIVCSHCGKEDTVNFKPYEGSVVLCQECMKNPNVERVGGKIYHNIICSVCGKQSKVPFKPDEGSRVLCRDCHTKECEEKQRQREYFAKHHPSVVYGTKIRVEIVCARCGNTDVLPFVPKTHGDILCRQCAEKLFGDEWAHRNRVAAKEYPFTCARCAAQDFVPFKPKPGQELLCKHCMNDEVFMSHTRDEMDKCANGSYIRKNHKEQAENTEHQED